MTDQLPNLETYWMPFTGNRYFKNNPRMFTKASGMFYTTDTDQQVLDGASGLWCCITGHCHQTEEFKNREKDLATAIGD